MVWKVSLATLGLQALAWAYYLGSPWFAWTFVRYAWLPILLGSLFWFKVFQDWPQRGLFHWLSVLMQGWVWTFGLALAGLLVLAIAKSQEPDKILPLFEQSLLILFPSGTLLSIFTYYFMAQGLKAGERGSKSDDCEKPHTHN